MPGAIEEIFEIIPEEVPTCINVGIPGEILGGIPSAMLEGILVTIPETMNKSLRKLE